VKRAKEATAEETASRIKPTVKIVVIAPTAPDVAERTACALLTRTEDAPELAERTALLPFTSKALAADTALRTASVTRFVVREATAAETASQLWLY
jgi:hypothetical protein